MSSAEDRTARAGQLIERLLVDAGFRAHFRSNPVQACLEADLPELAHELSGSGKAMHTLELRESHSSLAGVVMAMAVEGVGVAELHGLLGHGVRGPAQAVSAKLTKGGGRGAALVRPPAPVTPPAGVGPSPASTGPAPGLAGPNAAGAAGALAVPGAGGGTPAPPAGAAGALAVPGAGGGTPAPPGPGGAASAGPGAGGSVAPAGAAGASAVPYAGPPPASAGAAAPPATPGAPPAGGAAKPPAPPSSPGPGAVGAIPAPGGGGSEAVQGKISWFGGPHDPSATGTPASGVPITTPGIAVFNPHTLGGYWRVTMPNGHQAVLRQTDIGPHPSTGRKIDFTYSALPELGYTESNFPTNANANATYLGKSPPAHRPGGPAGGASAPPPVGDGGPSAPPPIGPPSAPVAPSPAPAVMPAAGTAGPDPALLPHPVPVSGSPAATPPVPGAQPVQGGAVPVWPDASPPASSGGDGAGAGAAQPAPVAAPVGLAGLLQSPRLSAAADVRALLAQGSVDPRLVSVLDSALASHTIGVGQLASAVEPAPAQALDIVSVDGQPVGPDNIGARDLITEIAALDPSVRPSGIGTPWPIRSPGFFTDASHQNRLQLAFETPPASAPPAAAAGMFPAVTPGQAAAGSPAVMAGAQQTPGQPLAGAGQPLPVDPPGGGGNAKVQAMIKKADSLLGKPYIFGGGHAGWGPQPGYDCSSFVSAVLHAGGYLSQPVDTTNLPSQPDFSPGPGRHVTVYDRAQPGENGHMIIKIDHQFYESGGRRGPWGGGGGAMKIGRPSASYLASFPNVVHPNGL